MTKWYEKNHKNTGIRSTDTPISIASAREEKDDADIICLSCRCNTVIRNESDDHCTRCGHTFNVKQEVDAADIIESESMDSHNETLISNLPDALDAYYKDKKPEYQGGIKSLYDRGIHITSYVEKSGDGRITNSWNDGSNSSDSQRRSAPRPFKEEQE